MDFASDQSQACFDLSKSSGKYMYQLVYLYHLLEFQNKLFIALKSIKLLVLVMVTGSVLCEVGIKYLYSLGEN
jgi:hypothetical protein